MSYLFFSPWLFALLAIPVLIHLINMFRHRRVQWAAMEFLLKSQKRRRNWIIFKQLLLLLLRIGAVAALLLMVFQPQVRDQWGKLFGGAQTHHIVLLDDSFSMADRRGDSSAFERAKTVVDRLARQALEQGGSPRMTVLRYSGSSPAGLSPAASLDQQFLMQLQSALANLQVSETSATAADALAALRRQPTANESENRIVYLVTDFRLADWNEPAEVRDAMAKLVENGAKVHLIHCVDAARPNLAISDLQAQVGIRAAGVELPVDVAVTNFGDEVASSVSVRLVEDGNARPGLTIDAIAPGETVVRQFPVNFVSPGEHTITARLEADALPADNARYAVIDLPDVVPALVIDGGQVEPNYEAFGVPVPVDSYFLIPALNPQGKVNTGVKAQFAKPQVLRNKEELAKFHTIYLLNVRQLDQVEVEALEQFVAAGGGLAIFPAELSSKEFHDQRLYREGEGLLPAPWEISTNLLASRVEQVPDINITQHPIFAPFLKMQLNPLKFVRVERYFQTPGTWSLPQDASVSILARLRNGAPLILEKTYGQGRVIEFLTKLAPVETSTLGTWNNWARTQSFLPMVLSLQGYLARGRQQDNSQRVGQPLELQVDPNRYERSIRFDVPRGEETDLLEIEAKQSTAGLTATLSDTRQSGIYRAELSRRDGSEERRLFAVNVAPGEGDLHLLDGQQLAARLEGIEHKFHRAEDVTYASESLAGFPLGTYFLYLLVGLLVAEQALAYAASYHPPRKGGAV